MQMTNVSDEKATLSKLIERVLQGEEIIIGKAGKPVAKLVPFDMSTTPRQLGAGKWRGQIWMADDFDDLPEDVLLLFTGEAEDSE
ncbi:MAG: antitoxin [Chloroflexota bacterium]|nr:type II toxin-antitoxin system prevent-host-death family antitoxin [Ardenticatenaceae bacterium]GIK56298.1 MAG: antitoxin [Chloroflexota bacterium]